MTIAGRASPRYAFRAGPPAALLFLQAVAAVAWLCARSEAAFRLPADNGRECYRTAQDQYVLFGSKTTYGAVCGHDLHTPSDCTPIQVWMMSRHGTRHPSEEKIEELKTLNNFKTEITAESTMCPEDIAGIKNWDLNMTKNDHYLLNTQGIEEIKLLAMRLKRQFPQIFNTAYDDSKFKFLSSHKPRAMQTATVFFQSIFNKNPETNLPIASESDERIYLDKCEHVNPDDDNDKSKGEVKKFEEGPHVKAVVSRVSMAMGLKQNLSFETVSLMWTACKYEKSRNIHSRPAWCALFTKIDLEILEYLEDLKYYYENAYGNPIGERMGCPILKDLINNFKDIARGKAGPLGIFYFGHSPNVLSLVTRLGIRKDMTPLLSTNFEEMKNRSWRTSLIDPFASNVISVFYKCRNGSHAMILLNENAVHMGKNQCKLCPWESIENQFDPITSNNRACNLDVCKNSTASSSRLFIVIIVCMCILFEKYLNF